MSETLLKMMRSAGGISPSLLQCEPLWAAMLDACETWSNDVLGFEMKAQLGGRRQVTVKEAQSRIREKFGYVCLPSGIGGLRAISLSADLAERFVARRLKEDLSHIEIAPPLFLRLMCDKPMRRLMEGLAQDVPAGPPLPDDFMVADPAGVPGGLDDGNALIAITVNLFAKGALEPTGNVQLYYNLEPLVAHAEQLKATRVETVKPRAAVNKTGLIKSIRCSNIGLDAVLAKLNLSVADCSGLKVGQIVPLDDAESGKLYVHAETLTGSAEIGSAELGNWKGQRAIKLTSPLRESFIQEISGA